MNIRKVDDHVESEPPPQSILLKMLMSSDKLNLSGGYAMQATAYVVIMILSTFAGGGTGNIRLRDASARRERSRGTGSWNQGV
ncbi:hypothetical protein HJFPF1_08298 [Paramyrothecium foliicola]|nr:hypothetical protein HJFPF1_08298 [Paramyrothecium foliicola]